MTPPIPAPDSVLRLLRWLVVTLFACVTLTGCQTHKIDWNSRVGIYTFDDAVKEFGPPDKSATLTDGTMVCEWLTNRGADAGMFVTSSYYGTVTSASSGSPDIFIRLTFNPKKVLTEYKTVYK